jgi:hypothetical protein
VSAGGSAKGWFIIPALADGITGSDLGNLINSRQKGRGVVQRPLKWTVCSWR